MYKLYIFTIIIVTLCVMQTSRVSAKKMNSRNALLKDVIRFAIRELQREKKVTGDNGEELTYVLDQPGKTCSTTHIGGTEDECKKAAYLLNLKYDSTVNSPALPGGCFSVDGAVYYNLSQDYTVVGPNWRYICYQDMKVALD